MVYVSNYRCDHLPYSGQTTVKSQVVIRRKVSWCPVLIRGLRAKWALVHQRTRCPNPFLSLAYRIVSISSSPFETAAWF